MMSETTGTTASAATPTDTLTDTSNWLPLDGLAPGFDANKAAPTADLAGRQVVVTDARGGRVEHAFGETTVRWAYHPGQGDSIAESSGEDPYEAVVVDDDLYYVQFHHTHLTKEAVSLFLDFRAGRVLTVIQSIHDRTADNTAVSQNFVPGLIEGTRTMGAAPAPTNALIGRRVLWVYSPIHAYEHVYLSPRWYTWQCLAGPEKGLADTDQNTVFELRPGIYVFAWREKVIPCASVTVADHRDDRAIRSHGVLFGLDETGTTPTHFTMGAFGRLISTTVHPEAFDPGL